MSPSVSMLADVKEKHVPRGLHRMGRALTVRPSEWRLLWEMVGLLARLTLWQRRLPLPVLMERFNASPTPEEHPSIDRTIVLANGLLRLLYRRDYCMKRTLLLFHFLTRWGCHPVVHFGVKMEEGRLKGHAWIELDGQPLAEEANPYTSFRTTYSYPT